MDSLGLHRPRNVDWKRAAGLLYGDWGTSKAYVIGLGFLAAGFSSLPIIVAVCLLTALVAYNYIVICAHFPDGGGVYSAARDQSRVLAVMGALLLVANFTVTAALSGWTAMSYFGVPRGWIALATIALIMMIGAFNSYGPKHSGSLAMTLAVPMVVVVLVIVLLSLPHLSSAHLHLPAGSVLENWRAFAGVILALSGVEAVANLTGVMRLDPNATMDKPQVRRTSRRAILPVAVEVVLGTTLLGWAMLSLPDALKLSEVELKPVLEGRYEDMLRFLAEAYGGAAVGPGFARGFSIVTGLIVGLLLLSAVNTAVAALIGLIYMLARDGELPRGFARLNAYGVPRWPLFAAVAIPVLVVAFARNLQTLADLYAIGVVGAIAVNVGSCTFNQRLPLRWYQRGVMGISFLVLFAVELTIAKTKPDALFFACCVLGVGLGLRGYTQRRAGLRTVTVAKEVAAAVAPQPGLEMPLDLQSGQAILVAARGVTPVLRFALEEARLRKGHLYVLYVKELAVALPGPLETKERPRWQDDKAAVGIMSTMLEWGRRSDVQVVPLYAVSEHPASTILDLSATLGIDMLILGSPHRNRLVALLKGNVVTEVARNLPESIQLVIFG